MTEQPILFNTFIPENEDARIIAEGLSEIEEQRKALHNRYNTAVSRLKEIRSHCKHSVVPFVEIDSGGYRVYRAAWICKSCGEEFDAKPDA